MITRADRTNDIPPGALEHRSEAVAGESAIGPSWSPSQVARYWGVSPRTIHRDIGKGALKAYRLPSGHLRIRLTDARRYGKPIE